MHLQVTTEKAGTATVVSAAGELDLHTAPDLDAALQTATADQSPLLVVDLSGVDFMDSTGLSVIVGAVARTREYNGRLRVVATAERITKVFTLTGVDQQVDMYDTRSEAVAG